MRQYLNQSGGVFDSGASRQFMSSWGALFNSLRRGFPGADYHAGFNLVKFTAGKRAVTAAFDHGREATGSLLVGGGGAWSWKKLTEQALKTFLDKFTFFRMPRSHILCYAIPGADEPHTGASAAKAAADGMRITEVLAAGDANIPENLRQFEMPQMEMGLSLRNYGMRVGNYRSFRTHLPGHERRQFRAIKRNAANDLMHQLSTVLLKCRCWVASVQ